MAKRGKRQNRRVHIDDQVWRYRVGRSYISIWSPEGQRTTTDESAVTGIDYASLERAYWKGYARGVGPGEIKQWIQKNLLPAEG